MTVFRYVAYTEAGKRRRGNLVADNRSLAAQALKTKGLFAVEIEPRAARPKPGLRWRRAGLTADERTVFTRQLEVLLSAEIPIDMALETIETSGGSPRLEAVSAAARAALREGETLSRALEFADPGFPPFYLASVTAGETAGELPRVIGELASHFETAGSDQAKIATALVYPAFVAAVSLLVCAVLVTSVAPEIVGMFEVTGQPLPDITLTLLAIVDWLERWWPLCLAVLAGGAALFWAALRVPAFRDRWHGLLLRLPLVGRLMRLSAAQQYLQTLALVISSRQTSLNAVVSATRVLHVSAFIQQSHAVQTAIDRGQSLSDAMKNLSFVPGVCQQLIDAGERSARVSIMAERAAKLVSSWLEADRKRIAALLDPILMMCVGGFVLVVVLAILLPIFEMQSFVGAG